MNFTISPEQTMLQDSVNRYLHDQYSFEARRKLLEGTAFSPSIWADFASSLGILGAALPEQAGGLGGGPVESMVIMEALGSALVLEPYLETAVIGGGFLKRSASPRAKALLSAIVAGAATIAFAASEPTARYALNDIETMARREGDGWVLDGLKAVVIAAPFASHLIVTARTSGARRDLDGISLFLVDRGAAGLASHDYRLIDGRPAADLTFAKTALPADALLTPAGSAFPLIEQVVDEAIAAICAEAVGGMRRMLQDTIDYTRQRRQFGQPLASFQVLQHRMVDMYMALEQAVSAVYLATLKLDADPITRSRAASAAKVTIGKAARSIAQDAVQLHGGMGMTDELAVGHYFKRATVIEGMFGSVDHHIARYGALSRASAA